MSKETLIPRIAIVIPFFQKQSGLLRTCVESILAQEGVDDFLVIVVDDGSPVKAGQELAEICAREPRIKIIEQANAGPGAARNAGLDSVPKGTEYVTFLDSDDQWTDSFLSDAVDALDRGFDMFIGNSRRSGVDKPRFEWSPDPALNILAEGHPCIDSDRELYRFSGDFFNLLVYRSSIVSANTIAYRFGKLPKVRFNEQLFNGQDRVFKLSLKEICDAVAFSPKVYAFEGAGVNIFDRSQWGSEQSIRFLSSYIELPKTVMKVIALNGAQQKFVLGQLRELRRAFAASVLHLLMHRKDVDWRLVLKTFQNDPMTAVLFLPNAVRIVLGKLVA
ncbi:MAG: glycosyltransferase family 2 protein [Roseobacter sp.]|nr:glycosyltransferase family 2 protein [Roseobacter sp.]